MGKQTREQRMELQEKMVKLKEEKVRNEKELRLLKDKYFAKMERECNLLRHVDELRREQIELLQKTFEQKVEKEVESRLRQIKEEMLVLSNQLEEQKSDRNTDISSHMESSQDRDLLEQIGNMLESELRCGVCSELMVFATTLNCMHTFCQYCIKQWKKNRIACPICRKAIVSENRNFLVDNVIGIVIDFKSEEEKSDRRGLIQEHTQLIQNLVAEASQNPFRRLADERNSPASFNNFQTQVEREVLYWRSSLAEHMADMRQGVARVSSNQRVTTARTPPSIIYRSPSVSASVSRPPTVTLSESEEISDTSATSSASSSGSARILRPRSVRPQGSGQPVRRLQSATRGTTRPRWRS